MNIKLKLAAIVVCLAPMLACAQEAPLKSGQRLVFLGDSITEQKTYTKYVMTFLTMRYPEAEISFRNAGISGDTAGGGVNRLQTSVLALKPSVVTICFGMNDGRYVAFDQAIYDGYMSPMSKLLSGIQKGGAKPVVLSPGCVDTDRRPSFKGYNDTLCRFADGLKEHAAKAGIDYFDLHRLMIDVQTRLKAADPKATMIGDGVHPDATGQLVMAYGLLKAIKADRQAASLDINAADGKADAQRCTVSDLKVAPDSITFNRLDQAMPTYIEPSAAKILELLPFVKDFNQYNFKVTGLKQGKWNLVVDGTKVGSFSDAELAAGVNLAMQPGPWQVLGEKINKLSAAQESAYFTYWRRVQALNLPAEAKAEYDALEQKVAALVEQAEKARLDAIKAPRNWAWSLIVSGDAKKQ